MKSIILLILLVIFPIMASAESLMYQDEAGNIYFADSLADVPGPYRNQVVHRPKFEGSAKDLEKYNKEIETLRKKHEAERKKAELQEQKRIEAERKKKEAEAKARAAKLKKAEKSNPRSRSRHQDSDADERQGVRVPND